MQLKSLYLCLKINTTFIKLLNIFFHSRFQFHPLKHPSFILQLHSPLMETKESDTICVLPCRPARFFSAAVSKISGERRTQHSGCNSKERRLDVFIKAAGRRNELLVCWDEKEYILQGRAKNENKLCWGSCKIQGSSSDHLFKFAPAL
jgi:hypothetical protein